MKTTLSCILFLAFIVFSKATYLRIDSKDLKEQTNGDDLAENKDLSQADDQENIEIQDQDKDQEDTGSKLNEDLQLANNEQISQQNTLEEDTSAEGKYCSLLKACPSWNLTCVNNRCTKL